MQSSHDKQTLALKQISEKIFYDQQKIIHRFLPTHFIELFTSIPYIQGVSNKIRVLNGAKVAMKPHLTIRKLLPSLKNL